MAERRRTIPMHAQDKLAFLLALVPYLIEKERIGVAEVAAHFDVAPEEIRRAVRLIAVSGIPGETEQYQAGDLFDIAWDDFEENDHIVLTHLVAIDDSPRFSAREAAALITGLQYLSSLPENRDNDGIQALMAKLSRGASARPSAVAVSRSGSTIDDTLALVREAIVDGVQLEFDYLTSRGGRERRPVDPLVVESVDSDWYLRAWCHLRVGVRTFRLDRMSDVVVTDRPLDHDAAAASLPERLFDTTIDDVPVEIEFDPAAQSALGDYLSDATVTAGENGLVRATVRVAHIHGLKRVVVGNAPLIRVIAPAEARDAVADWAGRALEATGGAAS